MHNIVNSIVFEILTNKAPISINFSMMMLHNKCMLVLFSNDYRLTAHKALIKICK